MMFSEKENSGKGGLGGHASNQLVAIESPAVYKCSPVTNYDRLISKSPEELAKWLERNTHYQNGDMPWEVWLRQEANCE